MRISSGPTVLHSCRLGAWRLGVCAAALLALGSANAWAQQGSGAAAEEEEIVVTGSRIARDPNLGSPVPVTSVSGEDITLSGSSDATELLNEIPALLNSTAASESIDNGFSVGQSTLNLRGLGAVRTLVLVNGRRHVGGVGGTAIVDVSSIPTQLIARTDVLTGGAGAVYGSDAVTGVVNFVLKQDYEGYEVTARGNLTDRGDGGQIQVDGIYGRNFAKGRGNVTLAGSYQRDNEIRFGSRPFTRNNGLADDLPNPALRFQAGDIGAGTPNFAQFYNLNNGLFPTGFSIPDADTFVADYTDAFGVAPNLSPAELALIGRAANAPARAIARQPTFSISSNRGVIAPGGFTDPGLDLDRNGVSDCVQSSVGFNSLFDFAGSFGAAGGCFVVNDDGSVRPYQDGQIAGIFNQFGGDGIANNFDANFLTPEVRKYQGNVTAQYEFTPAFVAFFEGKYVFQRTRSGGPLNTFYDLLTVAPDNPFIPDVLQSVADDQGGLFITRDPTDLGPNISTNKSQTIRIVGGLRGDLGDNLKWELSGNYGRYDLDLISPNSVIVDRFFAAIDVTTDANGNPICRSDISPLAPPTTPFDIPVFAPAFLTFNPGDGQCRPANILGGPNSISAEAVDFITTRDITESNLQQLVFSGFISGDSDKWFKLPAGAIGFAAGAEYRREESITRFSGLNRGVIPVAINDVFGDGSLINVPAGTTLADPRFQAGDPNSRDDDLIRQNSLLFDPDSIIRNSGGAYDVWEVYGEASIPILKDVILAKELTINGAVRYANYAIEQVGSVLTWNVSGEWSPVRDIRFRVGYARPVRAPNVNELFSPEQGAFFRPNDPCDQAQIDALVSTGDPRGPIRAANCLADGIQPGFEDPLSARFSGVTAGNRDLVEEEARSFTAGGVIQPRWIPGLNLSADYWNIEIRNAITAPSAQDIVDSCYDSASFPNNQFCQLFSRNENPASPQFQGFNFLRQQQLNVAALEASGVDFDVTYRVSLAANDFQFKVAGSRAFKINNFFDPGDVNALDPELGELRRPRWAGNLSAGWSRGPFSLGWNTQYLGRQALRAVEIETVNELFGPAGIANRTFIHDLNGQYQWGEHLQVFGGVTNITGREPFITEQAFPVSPLGRTFFLGVTFKG